MLRSLLGVLQPQSILGENASKLLLHAVVNKKLQRLQSCERLLSRAVSQRLSPQRRELLNWALIVSMPLQLGVHLHSLKLLRRTRLSWQLEWPQRNKLV